ncbi:MAG: hypothetical protein LLG44_11115 [Chloroflexi bacterium]|nr:hypothetical protein [Chloroflexota bacterium]
MRRIKLVIAVLSMVSVLTACGATSSITPTAQPTAVLESVTTVAPTEEGGAPEATFTEVGSTATLSGQNGAAGKAVVAGLQTLIIVSFSFDGKAQADLRLVKASDPGTAAYVLTKLERTYSNETLQFTIPGELGPGTADSIAVFDIKSGQALAIATFK